MYVSSDPLTYHEIIASLDPLSADEIMGRLPALNHSGDVPAIVELLTELLARVGDTARFGRLDAVAVMRELGFFLGSLRRHGLQPVREIPGLEPILERLAHMTDMPPRDTLLHCTVWNPPEPRMRRFTDYRDELCLLESVRRAMRPLESAIHCLQAAYEIPPNTPEFVSLCDVATKGLSHLVKNTLFARSNVSLSIFARELRPYFDSIVVADREYLGPGAVEMPVFLVDHILWSANTELPWLVDFKRRYLPYILPSLRAVYRHFESRPSLIERVLRVAHQTHAESSRWRAGLAALRRVFSVLIQFRAPHTQLAGQAYAVESGGSRDVGSGGYSPDVLREVLECTRQHRNRLAVRLDTPGGVAA